MSRSAEEYEKLEFLGGRFRKLLRILGFTTDTVLALVMEAFGEFHRILREGGPRIPVRSPHEVGHYCLPVSRSHLFGVFVA